MTLVELLHRLRRTSVKSPLTVHYYGVGPLTTVTHSFTLMYGTTRLASFEIKNEEIHRLDISDQCPWEFAKPLLALKEIIDAV